MKRESKYQRDRRLQIRRCALDAIKLLRARGWCQGRPRAGRIGMWEAIWEADPTPDAAQVGVAPNVIAMVDSRICATTKMRHLFRGKKMIPRWNDKPGRTVDEVIAMLEAVANDLRKNAPKFPFHYRDDSGRLMHQ